MTAALPPELETLTAAQVAASFGRSRDWWSRVRLRYETEFGFPPPAAPAGDARKCKGGRAGAADLVYNKAAVIEWHRRRSRQFGQETVPTARAELPFNLAALDAPR